MMFKLTIIYFKIKIIFIYLYILINLNNLIQLLPLINKDWLFLKPWFN